MCECTFVCRRSVSFERHLGQSRWKYEDRGARGTLPPRTKSGECPQWPRVKSAHSSFFLLPFLRFFRPLSNGCEGRGVGTCEECDTKNRLPARYSSETDGCLISRGLRNRGPIEPPLARFIAPFAVSIWNRQSGLESP